MMKNLCFGLLIVSAFLFTGCNDGANQKLSSADSTAIYNAMAARQAGSREANDTCPVFSFFNGDSKGAAPINEARARTLHMDYLNGKVLPLQDNGKYIRYFSVEADDATRLKSLLLQEHGLRLYFGYDASKSDYHLVMTVVDKDGKIVKDSYFNEFKPCPDQCLVSDNPTDLNYDAQSGTYVQGSTLISRKNGN
jgi:hypothetical protein